MTTRGRHWHNQPRPGPGNLCPLGSPGQVSTVLLSLPRHVWVCVTPTSGLLCVRVSAGQEVNVLLRVPLVGQQSSPCDRTPGAHPPELGSDHWRKEGDAVLPLCARRCPLMAPPAGPAVGSVVAVRAVGLPGGPPPRVWWPSPQQQGGSRPAHGVLTRSC